MTIRSNISCIAALSTNRLIGVDGSLPWYLPKDLQTFKRLTMGKPILMGRKTYASIGRPLPNRENLVLSRSSHSMDGVRVFGDLSAAVDSVPSDQELMIIGGGEIYRLCLPMANRLYLSVVEGDFEGDAYFPALESDAWRVTEVERFPQDDRNAHSFTLYTLNRTGIEVAEIPTFLFD